MRAHSCDNYKITILWRLATVRLGFPEGKISNHEQPPIHYDPPHSWLKEDVDKLLAYLPRTF